MKRTYNQVSEHNGSFGLKSEKQEKMEGISHTVMRNMVEKVNRGLIMCQKWQKSPSEDVKIPKMWTLKYLVILPVGELNIQIY